jgi:hypothetical protein
VIKLADALDSKFRNRRFYLITFRQKPITFFVGKMSFLAAITVGIEGPTAEGRK